MPRGSSRDHPEENCKDNRAGQEDLRPTAPAKCGLATLARAVIAGGSGGKTMAFFAVGSVRGMLRGWRVHYRAAMEARGVL